MLMLMMVKVKDVLVLMEARQVAVMMMKVTVLLEVKVMVKESVVEALLLFSLSSTLPPRTRPEARVWAWGAKGLGCLIVLPAPGQPSAGPFS